MSDIEKIHPVLKRALLDPSQVVKVKDGECLVPWQQFKELALPNHCSVAWGKPYHDTKTDEIRLAASSLREFFLCSLRGSIMSTHEMGQELNSKAQPLCKGCYRANFMVNQLPNPPRCIGFLHVLAWQRKHPREK